MIRSIAFDAYHLWMIRGTYNHHVSIIGSGLADRLQHDGWFETLIQKAYPQADVVIRNLAYSGDEVVPRLVTDTGAARDQWLANLKTDVVLAFYGFNESFAGPDGVGKFKQELDVFLKDKQKVLPCAALLEGILDGTVDCLGTDHAPHTKAEAPRWSLARCRLRPFLPKA